MKSTKTPVRDGDTILVLPVVTGGAVGLREPQTPTSRFSQEEIRRYGRHLIMPEVGMEGQRKLKGAKVLLIGTGGLGSPLSLYLAAAGVGRIGLVDFDIVDESNLQRQVIYSVRDVGRPKLEAAKRRIVEINQNIQVDTYETRLNSENALAIIQSYDVVVDGTDNFPTRYLVNDACVLLGKPNVYGSIFRFEGQGTDSGAWFPDPLIANVTKISVTRLPYEIQRIAEDIGGGMISCMPSELDLKSPSIGRFIEKYYRGTHGVTAEKKLRAAELIESMVAGPSRLGALCMHGGGSPAAAQMAVRQLADLERKKELAKRLAGI